MTAAADFGRQGTCVASQAAGARMIFFLFFLGRGGEPAVCISTDFEPISTKNSQAVHGAPCIKFGSRAELVKKNLHRIGQNLTCAEPYALNPKP